MHTDSVKNLAIGFADRLNLHVRIVHGHGLQIREEVQKHRGNNEPAANLFGNLGDVTGMTTKAGKKLIMEAQALADDQGWTIHNRLDSYDDLKPLYSRVVVLNKDICETCTGLEPLEVKADGDWREKAEQLLRGMWYHAQQAQQYVEYLRRTLMNSTWRDEPGFMDVYRVIVETESMLTQELECMTISFNSYSYVVDDKVITTTEYKPRVCIPALEISAEYELDRDFCPSCKAKFSPLPPYPIY